MKNLEPQTTAASVFVAEIISWHAARVQGFKKWRPEQAHTHTQNITKLHSFNLKGPESEWSHEISGEIQSILFQYVPSHGNTHYLMVSFNTVDMKNAEPCHICSHQSLAQHRIWCWEPILYKCQSSNFCCCYCYELQPYFVDPFIIISPCC